MNRVVAVIVHHRGLDMLSACLESLLRSEEVGLQVVIVLNGCDEPLPSIVDADPRIHTVDAGEPVGFSAANNLGVAWAEAHLEPDSWWYFLNNDTVSEPRALSILIRALERDPDAAVAGPQLLIQWAPNHLNSLGLNVTDDGWGWDEGIGMSLEAYGDLPGRREVLAVTGSAILIRSDAFREVRGWTEVYDYYFEDIDLCLKVRRAGWTVLNEPEAVVHHAVSATTGLDSEWKLFLFWRNRLILTFLHWPIGRLLRRVWPVVFIDEIVAQLWQDSRLQRKALISAVGRLPRVVWLRLRLRGRNHRWTELLRPAGSVPVITLPSVPEEPGQPAPVRPDRSLAEEAVRRWRAAIPEDRPAVVVLGAAPLPFERARMNFAPGGRTWQMVEGLAAEGHRLLVLCERIPGGYDDEGREIDVEERRTGVIIRMSPEDFHHGGVLPGLVDAADPACLVGATARPSGRAVGVADGRPVWVDLFGDPMAEGQARAARMTEGDQLGAYRDLTATLLENGDAFSVVSEAQRDAALGQLGLLGRLNRDTAGYDLVEIVPCAVEAERQRRTAPPAGAPSIPDRAVVVLWSGGFNTWCDIPTLVGGVEHLMRSVPEVHLVVTGGAVRGHDDASWSEWERAVARSAFSDRIHLLGHRPTDEVAWWVRRADLGLVTEKRLVERHLGSSGRVMTWLGEGLPFVATAQCDLVRRCVEAGAAFAYEPEDVESLGSTLAAACADPERLNRAATAARAVAAELDAVTTTAPLRRWVERPVNAADRGLQTANPLSYWAMVGTIDYLEAVRVEQADRLAHQEAALFQARSALGAIHTSVMWRTWAVIRRLKAIVTYPWRKIRGRTGG